MHTHTHTQDNWLHGDSDADRLCVLGEMRRCFDGGGTGVIEGLGRRVAHHVECGRHGEHFDAFLRHNHGVFELRWAAAILGHSRPVVRPQTILPRTSIDLLCSERTPLSNVCAATAARRLP